MFFVFMKVFQNKTIFKLANNNKNGPEFRNRFLNFKKYKLEDIVEKEVTPANFGRIAAQTAKQVVMQKIREAERVRIMDEVNTKQDELLTVIVRRNEGENVYCDMGITQVEGVLGERDRIPGEKYTPNSRLKVFVKSGELVKTKQHDSRRNDVCQAVIG